MKSLLNLLLFFSAGCYAFGQMEFKPGYIIRDDKDTLTGWIGYRGNKSNARRCYFISREDSTGPVKEYSPAEIAGYRYENGKYYISKAVKVGDTEQRLFLEYLLHGKVDLYYYRDDNGDDHYLIEKEGLGLLPLDNDEKDVYLKDGFVYRQPSQRFIGVLKVSFAETPEISREAEQTLLSHKSLIRIARKYHESVCRDEQCIIYEKKLPKVIFLMGPVLGINLSMISATGNDFETIYYYFEDGKWEPSFAPLAGLRLLLNLTALNEKMFLEYDLTLQQMTSRMTSSLLDPVTLVIMNTTVVEQRWMAENRLLFRYELTPGRVRPVLLAGAFIGLGFANTWHRHMDAVLPTGAFLYSVDDYTTPLHNLLFGISIGTGLAVKLKTTSIQVDLMYTSALGIFDKLNTNLVTLGVGIPFRL